MTTDPHNLPAAERHSGRGKPDPAAHERAARRGLFYLIRRGWTALDDHWIGDLIGAVALFGALWLALLIGHAAGLAQ
ncbi:hypothetical protein [Tateyamaria sp.]|uniref:hypothetical protein n=1 Tax=Tateyamaria sp. TaxID=1929288 RepID=UPI003B2219B6